MAEKHEGEEEVIHQAPWVFFLTVAVCYGVLGLIMFGKWSADVAMGSEIAEVFGIQVGVLAVFLAVFAGIGVVAASLLHVRRRPEPLDHDHQ